MGISRKRFLVTHFIPLSGAGKPPTSGPAIRTHRVRPSEKTAFGAISGLSPQGRSSLDGPPLEGRPPHARNGEIGLAGACPHSATMYSFAPDDLAMPRLPYGLATRTHGVRPSEKTALRVMPGFSPLGHLPLDRPPRGGAGSARPQGRLRFHRGIAPSGHRAFVCPDDHVMPRHRHGLAMRTHRVRPSEKTALRVMLGFSPLGHLPLDCPPLERRAPHAR